MAFRISARQTETNQVAANIHMSSEGMKCLISCVILSGDGRCRMVKPDIEATGERDAAYSGSYHEVKIFCQRGECLNESCKRRRVLRVLALSQLPCVVAAHEQVNGAPERVDAPTEAARTPAQTRQIMAQVGVDGFN
jgi:hypothetical protein